MRESYDVYVISVIFCTGNPRASRFYLDPYLYCECILWLLVSGFMF